MIRWIVSSLIGLTLITAAVIGAVFWTTCRIYVPEDMCAVLIRKTGTPLPGDQKVATEPGQQGIQEEVLGPGRYFRNPYSWDWELRPLTVIPSGDPSTWEWIHSLDAQQRDQLRTRGFTFKGEFPKVGVVTRKVGSASSTREILVDRDSGEQGIWREVLTPGTYRLNPHVYDVKLHPAVVIPAGFVGVVTNLFGDDASTDKVVEIPAPKPSLPPDVTLDPETEAAQKVARTTWVRPLAEPGQRGTLRDVLQPGVYFINPKLQKVTLIEIGFNEYSQFRVSDVENNQISFPSDTGYNIRIGVTVVWGIDPKHAADVINEFGNVDVVLDKVIGPQLRSICRNIGSTFAARDFIQGERRERFQADLTAELQRVCNAKHLEVLLALVREIEVHAPSGSTQGEVTEDLKRTIQESHIAIENQITKEKQREAAIVAAKLEEIRKQVDIARETVKADTRVKVADIDADARKEAATIDAQAALEVAAIQEQVAKLEAQRIDILGQARANVEQMKNAAEAEGYRLLVDAFGSPRAYNLYTFAENFQPESIRLFFAGEGTLWTDLSRFEELGAAKLLKPAKSETEEVAKK